jgi:hypothetical protein
MILSFAGINIRLIFDPGYLGDSRYFDTIVKWYGVSQTVMNCFEIAFHHDPAWEKVDCGDMQEYNGVFYREEDHQFVFRTDSSLIYLDWRAHRMRVLFGREKQTGFFDTFMIWNLKLLVTLLVIKAGGVPCHSSGVTNGKESLLFSGQPGAGKTTIALLLRDRWSIYNDELNIIMPRQNSYYTFSTPFTSPQKFSLCSYGSSPLKKIFFIKQDVRNYTKSISTKEKYFRLLTSAYTVPTSAFFGDLLMENCEKIVAAVPMAMLHFINNSTIAEELVSLI